MTNFKRIKEIKKIQKNESEKMLEQIEELIQRFTRFSTQGKIEVCVSGCESFTILNSDTLVEKLKYILENNLYITKIEDISYKY